MVTANSKLVYNRLPAVFICHNVDMIGRADILETTVGHLYQGLPCTEYIEELLGRILPAKWPEPASHTTGHDEQIAVFHGLEILNEHYYKYINSCLLKHVWFRVQRIIAKFEKINIQMFRFLSGFGSYWILLGKVFSRPEKPAIYYRQTMKEFISLGLRSIGIVTIISFFMGAVITLQTAYNTENPIYPTYLIGLGARDSIILEFSSTIVALILAGKVGSNIASEIGTMRVTEQIDALEIMGVNSASYLILPKVVATVVFNPFLTLISIITGILGGWIVGTSAGVITSQDYVYGIQYAFIPYYITYALIKTVIFAFIITTVSAYQGYTVEGGSLEVGRASTRAVVYSSVMILLFNVILTQLLLS